ncbi:MAG: hypothetical protein WBF90_00755 [Rivularia sp. (in: cyanobacteria)]
MKSGLKNISLLVISILFVMLGISQKSQALDLRGIADHLLKRGICAALEVDVGDCNSEVDSPNDSNQGKSSVPPYPEKQNSPVQDLPTKPYPDSPQNRVAPIQNSSTQPR